MQCLKPVSLLFLYSSFFFATLRAFGFAASPAAFAGFLLAVLFNLALIFLRFLETPNDPFERFPFLDFLSPLPIETLKLCRKYKDDFRSYKYQCLFFLSVSCKTDNPATPESNDPTSTAIFEPSIKCGSLNASRVIKMDMVNPMPANIPKAKMFFIF